MDALSSCSNSDLKRLAKKHGLDILGMTEKHELVNALKKAVQGAVLLQEAGGQHTGADGGGAGIPARTILSGPSSCSIEQLVHLASERRANIHGLMEKHEVVNALQKAVPEALLLQEAAPSRPLAAPSRALAAPMGRWCGYARQHESRAPRHATEPLGADIPEPALDGRGGEAGAVHGVLLVPSLLRLAVLHVVRQVLLPLH